MADKPMHELEDGAIRVSIWRRMTPKGAPLFVSTVKKRYQSLDGKWLSSSTFNREELDRLCALLDGAREFIDGQ